MGILLFIIALILTLLLCPIGIAYSLLKMFLVFFSKLFMLVAIGMNRIGNVACADLFNDTLIKKESEHKFGDLKETISRVLGLNKRKATLTPLGKFVADTLNRLHKNHVEKASEDKDSI